MYLRLWKIYNKQGLIQCHWEGEAQIYNLEQNFMQFINGLNDLGHLFVDKEQKSVWI